MSEAMTRLLREAADAAPPSELDAGTLLAHGRRRVRRRRVAGVGAGVGTLAVAGGLWLAVTDGVMPGTTPPAVPAGYSSPVSEAPDLQTWEVGDLTVGTSERWDAWVARDPEDGAVLMDGQVEGAGVAVQPDGPDGEVVVVYVGREVALEDGIGSAAGTPVLTPEGSVVVGATRGTGGVSVEDGPDPGLAIFVTRVRCEGIPQDCISGIDTTGDRTVDTAVTFDPVSVEQGVGTAFPGLEVRVDRSGRAEAVVDGQPLRPFDTFPAAEGLWAWREPAGTTLVVSDESVGDGRVVPLVEDVTGVRAATEDVLDQGEVTVGGTAGTALRMRDVPVIAVLVARPEASDGSPDAGMFLGLEPQGTLGTHEPGSGTVVWEGATDRGVWAWVDEGEVLVGVTGRSLLARQVSGSTFDLLALLPEGSADGGDAPGLVIRGDIANRMDGGVMNADGSGPHLWMTRVRLPEGTEPLSRLVEGLDLDGDGQVDAPLREVVGGS